MQFSTGPIQYSTKKDIVIEEIRELILTGELGPGDRLLQDELAEQLNISQTPIREALRVLEAEGVLEHEPHKGVRVAEVSASEISEIYMIRAELESLAIREAVKNITTDDIIYLKSLLETMNNLILAKEYRETSVPDYQFHMYIYKLAKMPSLFQMIRSLWSKIPSDIRQVFPNSAESSTQEHTAILDALTAKDAKLSEECLRKHMDRVLSDLLSHLKAPDR